MRQGMALGSHTMPYRYDRNTKELHAGFRNEALLGLETSTLDYNVTFVVVLGGMSSTLSVHLASRLLLIMVCTD